MGLTTRAMQKTRRQSPVSLMLEYSEDVRDCKLMSAFSERIEFMNSHKYTVQDHAGHEHTIDYLNYHGNEIKGILVERKAGIRTEMHFYSNNYLEVM